LASWSSRSAAAAVLFAEKYISPTSPITATTTAVETTAGTFCERWVRRWSSFGRRLTERTVL
jgi:hypothetical protein